MTSNNLANLVKAGSLKVEPPDQAEFAGLVRSARVRLTDARNPALAVESRFDLAYNAAHAFALAALRRQGYRAESRYLVFQCLPHTLGVDPTVWRLLAQCHERRNLAEYEGVLEVDEQLLQDLLVATAVLLEKLGKLQPDR